MKDCITIKGARENNLKNIDLTVPRDKLIVFTGLSGSGKSSLAFETIFAEGQRRYVESLSTYARQFLGQMDKPDVDYIEGLSPAVSIDQKSTGVGADVGHQQCAGHLAQNGHDEIHQTLGDAALIHDVAGQNKERDGGQAELAHAHKGALGSGQHGHIQVNGRKDGSQGRDCNGVRDGHAEEQQHQQHCQNYE